MKRISSILALLVTFALPLVSSTAAAPSNETPSMAYSVKTVHLGQNGTTIVEGTSRMTVLRTLGASYRKLPNDTWLYHGFTSSHPLAEAQGCNQLVITFSRGKVTDLKLVNRTGAVLITKGASFKPTGSVVAEN
ncbi:MAG TPA: hypothetical protein VHF69_03840 [Candidatus Synoicihabitans sp.]|nr:hypothetical protein [Candidatus Synoicihabitans sp.]